MSGMVRLKQTTSDHHRGTLLSVIDEKLQPKGTHGITEAEAADFVSRGLAEWVAMPAALQESRLVQLEALTKKLAGALEEAQGRLDQQAQQFAALLRHLGLQIGPNPEVTHAAEQS